MVVRRLYTSIFSDRLVNNQTIKKTLHPSQKRVQRNCLSAVSVHIFEINCKEMFV